VPVTNIPVPVAHWSFDDTGSSGGGAVSNALASINDRAQVNGYDSSSAYNASDTLPIPVWATRQTAYNQLYLDGTSILDGHALVGYGGNPSVVIDVNDSAQITGQQRAAYETIAINAGSAPGGSFTHTAGHTYITGSTTMISSDLSYETLTINGGGTLRISGNVRLWVYNDLTLDNGTITLDPGATLELHVGHNIDLTNNSAINPDSSRSEDLTINLYNAVSVYGDLTLSQTSVVAGHAGVDENLTLNDSAAYFGRAVVGHWMRLFDDATFHAASTLPSPLGDTAAEAIDANYGLVKGAADGAAGAVGTALDFDGTDDYVLVQHSSEYLLDEGSVAFGCGPVGRGRGQARSPKDRAGTTPGGHLRS